MGKKQILHLCPFLPSQFPGLEVTFFLHLAPWWQPLPRDLSFADWWSQYPSGPQRGGECVHVPVSACMCKCVCVCVYVYACACVLVVGTQQAALPSSFTATFLSTFHGQIWQIISPKASQTQSKMPTTLEMNIQGKSPLNGINVSKLCSTVPGMWWASNSGGFVSAGRKGS